MGRRGGPDRGGAPGGRDPGGPRSGFDPGRHASRRGGRLTSGREKMSDLPAELSEPDLRAVLSVPEGGPQNRLGGAGAYLFLKGGPGPGLGTFAYSVVEGV